MPIPDVSVKLIVKGKISLSGVIKISGSKNATLPILAASILSKSKIEINRVPVVKDVITMVELLKHIGSNIKLDQKKKKACKPTKGKASAKRVDGKCVSYGQKGKAKGGGSRVKPGTSKGDAYCARSYGDMKSHGKDCSGKDRGTPLCLSRQKWDCSGKYSRK